MKAVWVLSLLLATAALAEPTLPPSPMADTPLTDPAQEAAAQALMHELRCLVCQNQTIADSHADMAGDMRAVVRERIAAGESPEAVRDWLIDRYGHWVSFSPPMRGSTGLLWLAPLLFLAFGIFATRRLFRKKNP